MKNKKIPYGVQNFADITEQHYYYVDKTRFIEMLESLGEKYLVFLRPRKFGKTLFVDTLSRYYDFNQKDQFENRFGNFYIGQNPTPLKNTYYILAFNFSGIQSENPETLITDFRKAITLQLSEFLNYYQFPPLEFNEKEQPATILREFFQKFKEFKPDKKIYLLIDEYDHFANELLSFQIETFKNVVSRTGFVRKFYEIIKASAGDVIDRIFITGVSPITLDSLTSGFNIAANMTRHIFFNEMLGFTADEVRQLLDYYDLPPDLFEEAQRLYNGYQFSQFQASKVFNSDMVLYFLKEFVYTKRAPSDILDTNITSDYHKLRKMLTLSPDSEPILAQIVAGDQIAVKLTREFNLERKQTKDDLISLLFYLGFLTIQKETPENLFLEVPNYAIRLLYFDYFRTLLTEKNQIDIETHVIKSAIEKIGLEGEIGDMIHVIEQVLQKLSNRDSIQFDEKYIKLILLCYLMMSNSFYVKSEYEANKGYTDILLLKKHPLVQYEALIELKYLKKSQANEARINETVNAAKAQISQYIQSHELQNRPNLKKWIILFVGDLGTGYLH